MAGCSPPKASNPSADTATEDEYSEAAGEHADENGAPLSMTAAEQASAGLRVETLAPMRLGEVLQAPAEVVANAYGVTKIKQIEAALLVIRH